jgi:hypothetical protein
MQIARCPYRYGFQKSFEYADTKEISYPDGDAKNFAKTHHRLVADLPS